MCEYMIFLNVPDCFKHTKMCYEAVKTNQIMIRHVLTHLIIKQLCDNVVSVEPELLSFIPK